MGFFIIKEPDITPSETGYFKNIIYGFLPSTIVENKELYVSLIAFIIFNTSIQIFMPYLIIYMKTYLSFSVVEYSVVFGLAILLGAVILIWTGVASWKIMVSSVVGALAVGFLVNGLAEPGTFAAVPAYWHLVLGGFAFGAVFMATDPVTSARTETGKYIYGFGIGAMTIIIRVLNPGYPEGMMLAILLMNVVAPFIDYCVVQSNVNARAKRVTKKN